MSAKGGAETADGESRADLVAYAFAALTMIPLGAWLRTPILNFLCGPAYVILVVTVIAPAVRRRLERRKP